MRSLLLFCLVFSCVSCAKKGVLRDGVFASQDTQYKIGQPGINWEQVSIKGIDLAWISRKDGSSLMSNSSCDKKLDIPLAGLTGQLLIGMTEQEIVEQKVMPWSGREALESTVNAKLDGVSRKMKIFVLKKDKCVFDIVLASSPEHFEENLKDYMILRDQFDAETN